MRESTKFALGDKVLCIKTPRDPSNIVAGDIAVVVPNSPHQAQGHLASSLAFQVLRKGSDTIRTCKMYCIWQADEACYKKIGETEIPMEDIINQIVRTINKKEGVMRYVRDISGVSKQKHTRKGIRNKRRG